MSRRLIAAVGAFALTPALLLGSASIGSSTVAASAGLPNSAVVKDPPRDGMSRPFDISRIKGAKVGENLVLTMTVNNLTAKNTKIEKSGGFFRLHVHFGIYLRANDGKKIDYTVGNSPAAGEADVAKYGGAKVPCDLDGDNRPDSTTTMDYDADTVKFSVPLACLPDVKTLQISGYTNDDRTEKSLTDFTATEPGGFMSRFSAKFSVQ